jgi:hypothetical protein
MFCLLWPPARDARWPPLNSRTFRIALLPFGGVSIEGDSKVSTSTTICLFKNAHHGSEECRFFGTITDEYR